MLDIGMCRKSISICSISPYTFTRTLSRRGVSQRCVRRCWGRVVYSHCAWLSGEKKSNSNVQIEIPTSFLPLGGTLVGPPVALHRTHTQTAPSHIHIQHICRYTMHNIVYIFGLRIVIFYCTHIYNIYIFTTTPTPPQVCAHVGWFAGKDVFCRGRGKSFVIENLVNETEVFSLRRRPSPPWTFCCKSTADRENSVTANTGALWILRTW